MTGRESAPRSRKTNAQLGATALVVATLMTTLLAGLAMWSRGAAAGASPRLDAAPGNGWIPDVPVAADPVHSERNPSLTTAADGDLYMAFDSDVSGSRGIYFTRSSDGGLTWSSPVVVADTASDEVTPSITQDPDSGRVFVAYELGTSGATPIHAAYSDDLVTWNDRVVLPCGVICVRPRIVSEYWNGPNNVVYVALSGRLSTNDWNTAVARSTNQGDSWTWYESGLGMTDVRYLPDIAVQKGSDGVDRVFVTYRGGTTFPGIDAYVEWSSNHGISWATRASWFSNVAGPIAIAAAHDGTSLLLAYNTSSPQLVWAQMPSPQDLSTFNGTWDFLPTAGTQPALSADGTGNTSTAIGGTYSLIAHDLTGSLFHVSAPVTLIANGDWSPPVTITDVGALPSAAYPDLSATSQNRIGTWHPAVAWTDGRTGNDDVYYTTPGGASVGSRVTIDTIPTGLRVTLDRTTRIAPASFFVSNGTHTVSVSSLQAGAPGWQYVFASWSDGGAVSHTIDVASDMFLTVSFGTQVQLTVSSARGGVAGSGWYDLGTVATVTATSPQPDAPGWQYRFAGWSGDLISTSLSASVTMDAPKAVTADWQAQVQLTLVSAQGGVVGGGWYDLYSTATIVATSPQAGANGTQYRFVTWTGDIASTSARADVAMAQPMTIFANWQTWFRLTVVSAHGNVTASNWFAAGTVATLRVQATEVVEGGRSWDFTGWSGDASGSDATLNVTMTAPMAVTANWQEKPSAFSGTNGAVILGLVLLLVAILLLAGIVLRRRKKQAPVYLPMQPTAGFAPPGMPPTAPVEAPPQQPWPPQPPTAPPQ